MAFKKLALSALASALGAGLVANAHPVPKHPAPTDGVELADPTELKSHHHETSNLHPKPGAALSFTHTVSGPIEAGDRGFVEIEIRESYLAGSMSLKASSLDGLDIIGAGRTVRKDLSDKAPHAWRVDFETTKDGVFYIPILATVTPDAGLTQYRSHAVRVEVGDWKTVQAVAEAQKSMQLQADGEMAIMMQAEETIE